MAPRKQDVSMAINIFTCIISANYFSYSVSKPAQNVQNFISNKFFQAGLVAFNTS